MNRSDPLSSPWLVVGPPRGGFTLLLSVLTLLQRDAGWVKPRFQDIADPLIACAGEAFDRALRQWFHDRVGDDRLFYSREFSILVGGPKWLAPSDARTACVRKYLGVKAAGDFTFVLYLPSWVLSFDSIVHSHTHPARWATLPEYQGFRRFASIRHPVDIVHSSVFSINALASEYIRRELKLDEHVIRRELALNKLTSPAVVDGLITFLGRYLDEFGQSADQYHHVMRWEDLIADPVDEITKIAKAAGIAVTPGHASRIWEEIEYRNLTRHHLHSFRRGRLDDWKTNMTNSHLRRFADAGFQQHLERHGYPPLAWFDESAYGPDQLLIEDHLARGEPYTENLDQDLITFAFNKTNLVAGTSFGFEHHPRMGAIEIERSSIRHSRLAAEFQESIAPLSSTLHGFLEELLPAARAAADGSFTMLQALARRFDPMFDAPPDSNLSTIVDALARHDEPPGATRSAPQLVASEAGYNVVRTGPHFLCVPQSLGPMDLTGVDVTTLPASVLVADSLAAALQTIASGASG